MMTRLRPLAEKLRPYGVRLKTFLQGKLEELIEDLEAFRNHPPADPLYTPRLVKWFVQQALKWVYLAFSGIALIVGVLFFLNNPLERSYYDAFLSQYAYQEPPFYSGSPTVAGSCLLIAWYLFNRFYAHWRKERPTSD